MEDSRTARVTERLTALRASHGTKALKYAGVSVVGIVVTQVLLFVTLQVLDWSPAWSNFTAVSVASVPAYLLNRRWVWAKTGRHSVRREVLPFWGMSLLGLVLSTGAVALVARYTHAHLAVAATNIASFGVLWVAKFFYLDTLMFGPGHHAADEVDAVDSSLPAGG